MYDVIIVGAGPTGVMAAISASNYGKKVLLIEKNEKPLIKLSLSGGGRCNVLNLKNDEDFFEHVRSGNKFLYSSFSYMNPFDIYNFLEDLGIVLKTEEDNKIFPVSNKSQTIIDALVSKMKENSVEIMYNTTLEDIIVEDNNIAGVIVNNQAIKSNSVILTTGGVTFTHTGSTGDGQNILKAYGHTITDLVPFEVPLISNSPFTINKSLMGVVIEEGEISYKYKNKIKKKKGSILFTHFGLSGPLPLNISDDIYNLTKDNKITVNIKTDLRYNEEILTKKIKEYIVSNPKKNIFNALNKIINVKKKLLEYILVISEIDLDMNCANLSNDQLDCIVTNTLNFPVTIIGTKPLNQAMVTSGGVSLKEVHSSTMESKLIQGLFLAGEILDIHGELGGYNITIAFSTGNLAGLIA